MKKLFLFFNISLLSCFFIFSQEVLKSTEEEYYDFLSLQGFSERPAIGYRTLSDSKWSIYVDDDQIWSNINLGTTWTFLDKNSESDNWFLKGIDKTFKIKILGPQWFNSYNTKAPFGQYDGSLWQGCGYNTFFTTGAYLSAFGFEAVFKPQLTFSQNKDFDYLPGIYGDTHSYFWAGNIDLVQRFGDDSFWGFDWGDSDIRFNFYSFTIGFGTQSPWLGPVYKNPMLGSNNAPSYPKFDFGLRKTKIVIPGIDFYFGDIEGRFWFGKLTESDYFDLDDENNENVLYGYNFSFSPSFINGLSIGGTKICITKWYNRKLQYLNPFYNDNDVYGIGEDQKASVYFDWMFSKVGFETYLEIGIDDSSWDKEANPFHTMIYTLGFKQIIPFFKGLKSELIIEFNNNEMSQDFQLQWGYMGYYAHGKIKQGYTQKGQIIGNGFSYFGNSQYLEYKVYIPKGFISLFFHRFNPDINYILNKAIYTSANDYTCQSYYSIYKTYTTLGLNSLIFISPDFSLNPEIDFTRIYFDMYDQNKITYNFRFCLTGKYNF